MFTPLHKQRSALALVIVIAILGISSVFSHLSIAQTSTTGVEEIRNATLRAEYFLPIQAQTPVEENKIVIGANECEQVFATGAVSATDTRPILSGTTAQLACSETKIDETLGFAPDLSDAGETVIARKTTSGLEMVKGNVTVSYPFILSDSQTFALRLSAFNAGDAFDTLTREEYNLLTLPVSYDYPKFPQMIGTDRTTSTNKELSVRAMLFQVALDTPTNVIGVVSVLDSKQINNAIINLGVVSAGEHKLYITFANDISIPVPQFDPKEIPPGIDFTNADVFGTTAGKVGDALLEKRPVVSAVELLTTTRTNDVMGVRVYSNPNNLPADVWYAQNLTTPGVPVPFAVDGFGGVIDGRTSYINAANVAFDATTGSSRMYTNIYVIAHNVNASTQTIEIFSRILSNWKFNKNIIENEDDATQEVVKGKLRRDVRRLEDLYRIRQTIEQYKSANGKYPTLDAGTYDPGHAVSTWPTWQSVLGNELGSLLPLDPINTMSREFYPNGSALSQPARQYDCTDAYESTFCKNICTRDANNNPATGCPSNQQCVSDQYCSLVPADVTVGATTFKGFDALTGWSEEAQKLYFNVLASNGGRHTVSGTKLGGYNTGGAVNNFNDDAFTYQYTALDGGQSYSLNYRFEYQAYCKVRRLDGSCKEISNNLCGPGACYIDGVGTNAGRCIDSGTSPFKDGTNEVAEYKNIYCFAGQLVNSCGNGILQADAGEVCEFNDDFGQAGFCDARYGTQQWYNENNVSESCTASCQLATVANENDIPLAYNPQAPGLSCGGYCGDGRVEFEFKEQCDAGVAGGVLKKPAQGGSGGVSADSQYRCTGASTVQASDVARKQYLTDGSFESNQLSYVEVPVGQSLAVTTEKAEWSTTRLPDSVVVDFENAKIKPVAIVNYGKVGDKALIMKGVGSLSAAKVVDISQGFVTGQSALGATYEASVYVKNFTTPTTVPQVVIQIEELDATGVVLGTATTSAVDALATLSDWTLLSAQRAIVSQAAKYIRVTLVVTHTTQAGVLFDDAQLLAKQSCQTFGGYCGDSVVQSGEGEQCDPGSFITPSPRRSVDQIANGGFEQGAGAWFVVTDYGVDTALRARNPQGLEIRPDEIRNSRNNAPTTDVSSGFSSMQFTPGFLSETRTIGGTSTPIYAQGIGQQVTFPAQISGTTTNFEVRASLSRKDNNVATSVFAKARVYQYDFTTGTNQQYLIGGSLVPYQEFNFVNTTNQATVLEVGGFKDLKALVTLAPPVLLATGSNINQATIVSIVFECKNGTTVVPCATQNITTLIDNVSIAESNFQLRYACVSNDTQLCQLAGGFCGDGVAQPEFGEACDLGSANGSLTGRDGQVCSNYCSAPFCGDGIKGVMVDITGKAKTEKCDGSDAGSNNALHCNESCSAVLFGGSCEEQSDCQFPGICVIPTGETQGTCVNPEETACTQNSQCQLGFSCDLTSNTCRPEVDTYLRYHLDPDGYGVPNIIKEARKLCPDIKNKDGAYEDLCTGIAYDFGYNAGILASRPTIATFEEALGVCRDEYSLPTIKQLLALVVMDSPRLIVPTPGVTLPTWPYISTTADNVKDIYAEGARLRNLLTQSVSGTLTNSRNAKDDRFVFWTRSGTDNQRAIVDLKRGSVDYVDSNGADTNTSTLDDPKFLTLCVLDTTCGDGIPEGNEQCDFNSAGIETFYGTSNACPTNFGQDGYNTQGYDVVGKLHCDPFTCRLRYDNCALISTPKKVPATATTFTLQSCTTVCQQALGVSAKSVGTNLVEKYPGKQVSESETDKNRLRNKNITQGSEKAIGYEATTNATTDYSVADDGHYVTTGSTTSAIGSDPLNFTLLNVTPVLNSSIGFIRTILPDLTSVINDLVENNAQVIESMVGGSAQILPASYSTGFSTARDTEKGNSITAPAMLCNCNFTAPAVGGIDSIDDEPFVQAFYLAEALVAEAENAIGIISPPDNFSLKIALAQTAVDGLYARITALGAATNRVVYQTPVDELQMRLFLAGENAVTQVENQNDQRTEAYSQWNFEEGAYRIAVNSGAGRNDLSSGGGSGITFKSCLGPSCTANLKWHEEDATDVGHIRSTLELDGDDYGITSGSYFNKDAFTFGAWVRPSAVDAAVAGDSIAGTVWSISQGATTLKLTINSSGSAVLNLIGVDATNASCTKSLTASDAFDPETWTHVLVSYNNTTYTMVINDGTPINIASGGCELAQPTPSTVMYVAGELDTLVPIGNLDARLDNIFLYDREYLDIDIYTGVYHEVVVPVTTKIKNTLSRILTTLASTLKQLL